MKGESSSGKKTTAEAAVAKMRSCRDEKNRKMFSPDEYLTKEQISHEFARLTREKKQGKLLDPSLMEDTTEAVEEIETIEDNEIDESLGENNLIQEAMEVIKSHFEIKINDFICLGLIDENQKVSRPGHFVGQVIAIGDEMIEVSFLVNKGRYYVWPELVDQSWISRDKIHLKLGQPDLDRRFNLVFSESDNNDMMKDCCK